MPISVNPLSFKEIIVKLKNILYRNFDNLNEVEHQFYDDNRDKYELNICDKYNTIHFSDELFWIEHDFELLSKRGIKECESKGYIALCEEAFEELTY